MEDFLGGFHPHGLEWCKGAPLETGSIPSEEFLRSLFQSDVVLINGTVPEVLKQKGLWTLGAGSKVKLIVYMEASQYRPRKQWQYSTSWVGHPGTGGVTNGKFKIWCNTQFPITTGDCVISEGSHVGQDLRWILKSGEVGQLIKAPEETEPEEALGYVAWKGRGLVSEAGLLPWTNMGTQVITRFRHNQWVIRTLSPMERLLALDVPEQLIRMCPDEKERQYLLNSIRVPVKILQCVVEHFAGVLRVEMKPDDTKTTHLLPQVVKRKWTEEMPGTTRDRKNPATTRILLETIIEENSPDDESINLRQSAVTESDTNANLVATKSDDAKVHTLLWDRKLREGLSNCLRDDDFDRATLTLRKYLLRSWKRKVLHSYTSWEKNEILNGRRVSKEVKTQARECCRRAFVATWWHWDGGSRPFFWRWPADYQTSVRIGVSVWFDGKVERWARPQREPSNPATLRLMNEKLEVIRIKGYVEKGCIKSLMSFFDVPKGKDDIRMVYDGTKSGLNASLWAPWFPLPTADSLVRSLIPGYSMADNDVGEMFHNFILHEDLRKYCGLDLTIFFRDEPDTVYEKGKLWERWNRLAMGLRNSPYSAVQGMMVAREVILGDPGNDRNVFRWDRVHTNLPGSSNYDPSHSWIAKVRSDGTIAADVFIYVDDIRTSAPTDHEAWLAAQRTSSILGYLGLQDAARKRREPGQETGAWTGSVVWTSNDQVVVLTTQDKWDKTRRQIKWISDHLSDRLGIDNKELKSIRGFLVYVARTYPSMVPYLKGIHATIDSWRPGRNQDGWKYSQQKQWTDELDCVECDPRLGMIDDPDDEPLFVFPVPRLTADIHSLTELTKSDVPPHRRVRMSRQGKVMYGFGDASKQGFGASIELEDKSVMWRSGKFTTIVQEQSSNYRELLNLVEYIEEVFNKGLLDNCELFMFTDNSTAEAAFFKGTSSSELLFNLVLRLRKIEMSGKCILHMIHVAGTRMIWQGTDGLSRGDRNAGVLAGDSMSSFLPLHLPANHRSPTLLEWVKTWTSPLTQTDTATIILSMDDWYKPIKETANYVWLPPPAIADVAAELMAQAIHKRPYSTHIFVCPRLMTARWMRIILKATDATWRIPIGTHFWTKTNHEPLILSIYFPLSRSKPWRHRYSPQLQHESKIVQTLLDSGSDGSGSMLRELLTRTRFVAGM